MNGAELPAVIALPHTCGCQRNDERRAQRHVGYSPRIPTQLEAASSNLVISGIGYLSCKTGRAAHLNDSVLVCSPFALTPGLSSKLSIAAVSPDFAQ